MNELVKELATKAKIQMCSDARLQEFAELIVRECVETLGTFEDYWTHEQQMELLKKHFGVEK